MADYRNDQNLYNNRENTNINGQGQAGKVPEYNFWAEEMSNNSYSSFNPNTDSRETQYRTVEHENNGAKKGKGRKVSAFILRALCFGMLAAVSFFGFQKLYLAFNPDAARYNPGISDGGFDFGTRGVYELKQTNPGTIQTKPRSAITSVVKETIPSIVSIRSTSTEPSIWFGQQFDQEVEGSGSGIIVGEDENELLIATNNHVVSGANKIKVTYIDGSESEAIIKGADAGADLAVITVDISQLKKETLDAIKIAKLGSSDEAKVGEMSIAIGNALGYGQSVTVGYISAKDREVEITDGYNTKKMILLQTDAAINPGNSGGALLNAEGEVIGINTVKYADNKVEGMGFAIPISKAVPIINELMSREILKEEEQGYLGIGGNEITEDVSSTFNIPIGVFVKIVDEEGAAKKAGILPGDILIGVDDIELTSMTQLSDYIKSKRVGTEVTIKLMRSTNGTYVEKTYQVTLGARPETKKASE
ncbi:MAG: trypsin-like serine protease [Lachnospiraceae bacterium]|jgi:serine protease Do|nr:trypsin-like serine protease [Lachnospiraceae bacterium]